MQASEPTPIYTGDSTTQLRSAFLGSQEALRTIEQNLTNVTLLSRVVRSEGLAQDGGRALFAGQSIVTDKSSKPAQSADASPAGKSATGVPFTPLEESLGRQVAAMVKPVVRRGTRLIDLYVNNRDPAMAQRLAEAIGREYIRASIESRASFSE